jgi:predicted NUDIX family NTP pyrophosphohydrolase
VPRISAGILVYRRTGNGIEVLLAHPGGPFWAKKDSWSVPKGEVEDGEDLLEAAKREFSEETGLPLTNEDFVELGQQKQGSSKINHVWALEDDPDTSRFSCKSFAEIEWPPKSGKNEHFPEVDKVAWFKLGKAKDKLFQYQKTFIDRLNELLGEPEPTDEPEIKPQQTSLL